MKKILVILTVFLSFSLTVLAQRPTHSANPESTPIDLSNGFDLVVFVILPIIIIVLFFVWRNKVRKEREKNDRKKNNSH